MATTLWGVCALRAFLLPFSPGGRRGWGMRVAHRLPIACLTLLYGYLTTVPMIDRPPSPDYPPTLIIPDPPFDHPQYLEHRRWMVRALALAAAAAAAGEVPVGAVVVGADGTLVAEGENRRERDHDPTAHAEIVALRRAGQRRQDWHLNDCTLYVSLEPCAMCAGAIVQGRVGCLVYGADDPKAGAVRSQLNLPDHGCSHHRLTVVPGILGRSAQAQLQQWFAQRRRSAPPSGSHSEESRP